MWSALRRLSAVLAPLPRCNLWPLSGCLPAVGCPVHLCQANCVIMLSFVMVQGLRKDFYSSAKSFAPVLLDKFKDKNTGVCRATTDALINMHK